MPESQIMKSKQRLELTWIGKEKRAKLEPRILLEDPTKSYHAKARVTKKNDIFDNRLIFGDNLLALKALEQEFTKKVNCIYIDPPYNTGNAFEHYDDGIEHSIWLGLMRDRIERLKLLLRDDGFFCCQIDEGEGPYLKVLLDEIFGRSNYITTFFIQVRYGNKTLAEDNDYQKLIESCFIYAKDATVAKPNKDSEEYKVEKFEWRIDIGNGEEVTLGGKRAEIFKPGEYAIKKVAPSWNGLKETWATGSLINQKGSSGEFLDKYIAPRKSIDGLGCLYKVYGIGEDGLGYRLFTGPKKQTATKGKFYSGIPLQTLEKLKVGDSLKEKPIINFYDLAANFGNCRAEGGVDFRSGKKPEALLEIILRHFSNPGDLVLDSFAGSGTTGAVAQKMGRRWIMVELGEHCHTHIIPRLRRVIDGEDKGGITEVEDWKGGGGFRYYRLATSLLEKDRWSNWVIAKDYNAAMLAEAVCKLMGFIYAPSDSLYWMHGHSSETDSIYVTTQSLTHEQLAAISDEVGESRSLLVCCKAFRANPDAFPNLTIKKIPQAVLRKCEWGKDDYSLKVENLPMAAPVPEAPPARRAKTSTVQPNLFAEEV
jgi:adenine-specific DNA-methyltransferase